MWDSLYGESLYLPINCEPKTALEKIKFYCFKEPVLCGTSYLHGILFVCLPQQNISQDFVSSLKGPRAYNYAWSKKKKCSIKILCMEGKNKINKYLFFTS